MKESYLAQLKRRQEIRQEIQRETIGQAENPAWFNEKSGLLTGSVFGKVCRVRSTSSYAVYISLRKFNWYQGNRTWVNQRK